MKSYGISDKGIKRKVNEDYIFCSDKLQDSVFKNLYIVADGVGSKNAGEYASYYATKEFLKYMKNKNIKKIDSFKTFKSECTKIIKNVNEAIFFKSIKNEKYDEMCTTFLIATVIDDMLYIANVGDSRLYIINGVKIKKITYDNNIKEKIHRMRNVNININLQDNVLLKGIGFDFKISPDIYQYKLKKDDIILLCSDGLTDFVSEKEIVDVCTQEKTLVEKVNQLVDLANFSGGRDNVSVIVVET